MSIRKIHYYNNVRNFKEAYNTGRLAAKPLGVNLPSNFFPPKLIADFAQYKFLKGRRKIDDIINLGQMSDEKLKMAILIMSTVARSAYQIRPELCVAVSAKMVNICLKHGNTDGGFIGFVAFGPIFHGAILNQKDSGFEFGKLTLDLVEKYKSHLFKAETHFVVGYFAMPWKRPVKEMEDYWKIAYEAGLEVGDFFHSSCACCGTIQSYFMRGMNYDEVLSASDSYLDFLKRIDNQEAILTIQAVRQSILNLKGRTESAVSYNDEIFNEEEYKESLSAFGSRHFAHYYYINKMQTLYLWGEYEKAYEISLISDKYLKDSPGMLHTAEHYFYKGLILASLLARQGRSKNRKWIASLTKIHKKFKTYAQGCENNFLHKSRLLEAELMNIKGKEVKAQSLYYSSIDAATKYGYLQIQALANELLARFNTNAGRSRLARFHLKDAEYCYNMLGAEAYAKYLTRRYSEEYSLSSNAAIGNQISENLSSNASNKTHIPDIDLSTILKSSAAISREIRLQDLLPTLMKIIIENAGAQRMVLLLKQGKELIVQAESIANTNEVKILSEVPLNKYSKLAKSIVNYVYNAKEPVILEDAAITGNFTNDEYVRTKKPRSILCAPLVKQGNITGIIYLENNLSHAAFTPERIDMLLLLSGQMAISIDNALLYDNLEDKVKERTLELEKEKDKSDSLLLNILPADIAQELKTTGKSKANHFKQVTVMFTDFQNFTQTSESLSAYELVEEINYYYSAFDNIITKHGIEKIKTIGDSYMCAGGLPEVKESNPYDTVMAALEINDFLIKESKNPKGKKLTKMRIGLHTGPVIAGIVGIKKFAYDIWGDTVNIASRMESRGEPGKINISETTYEAIKDRFNCTYRGKIEIKHKAPINMYFVDGMK